MTIQVNKLIKKRRIELGLTLKDVAKALNIAESTVSRYESNDIQNMGIDKIKALSKVLDCSPAYLMGWGDLPTSETTSKSITISLSEKALLKKYRTLDERGQHTISTVLDMEYNRCTNDYLMPVAAHGDDEENLALIRQDLDEL